MSVFHREAVPASARLLSLSSHAQGICPQTQNDKKHTGSKEWKSGTFRDILLEVPTERCKEASRIGNRVFPYRQPFSDAETYKYVTTSLEGRTQATGG